MVSLGLLGFLGPVILMGNEGVWVGAVLTFGGGVLLWNPLPFMADLVEPFKILKWFHNWVQAPKPKIFTLCLRICGGALILIGLYILITKGLARNLGIHISWSS